MIVFPTLKNRTRNFLEEWTPMDVPAYPAVWRFKPRELKKGEAQRAQIAEVFTIIVSPEPLVARELIGPKQMVLPETEFKNWRQWEKSVDQFDVENSAGQIGKSKGVEQVDEDGVGDYQFGSQTIYLGAIKPGTPILVRLPLRFKSSLATHGTIDMFPIQNRLLCRSMTMMLNEANKPGRSFLTKERIHLEIYAERQNCETESDRFWS